MGQVTAAQSDLLIAVWDGYDARGLGGTADVVEYAIRRGVPVIWVRADAQAGATIMWSGFDNLSPALLDRMSAPQRHCDAARLLEVATRLLAPPRAPEDRISLKLFFGERQRLFRFRPEYPLMLALTGTRPMSRSQFRVQPYAHAAKSEWAEFRKGIGTSAQSQAGLDRVKRTAEVLRDSEQVRNFTLQQWQQLGRRSLFDVMAAESEHYNLRVSYVNALHDVQQLNANLLSLGRGVIAWLQ